MDALRRDVLRPHEHGTRIVPDRPELAREEIDPLRPERQFVEEAAGIVVSESLDDGGADQAVAKTVGRHHLNQLQIGKDARQVGRSDIAARGHAARTPLGLPVDEDAAMDGIAAIVIPHAQSPGAPARGTLESHGKRGMNQRRQPSWAGSSDLIKNVDSDLLADKLVYT